EPLRVYNTLPDALLVNHKALRLTFTPDAEAKRVRIHAEPPLTEVQIVNQLALDNAPCGDWGARVRTEVRAEAGEPRAGSAETRAGSAETRARSAETGAGSGIARLVFTGAYSVQCGEQSRHYSVLSPQTYAGGLFRQLWGELGGRLEIGRAHV